MKRLKNKIGLIISLFLIFVGFNFSSNIVYLSELVGTVYKMQRTNADITDYKYFENITLSKVLPLNLGQFTKTITMFQKLKT